MSNRKICPVCHTKLAKNGFFRPDDAGNRAQRYKCKNCGWSNKNIFKQIDPKTFFCETCKSSKYPHLARGYCTKCYHNIYYKQIRKEKRKERRNLDEQIKT